MHNLKNLFNNLQIEELPRYFEFKGNILPINNVDFHNLDKLDINWEDVIFEDGEENLIENYFKVIELHGQSSDKEIVIKLEYLKYPSLYIDGKLISLNKDRSLHTVIGYLTGLSSPKQPDPESDAFKELEQDLMHKNILENKTISPEQESLNKSPKGPSQDIQKTVKQVEQLPIKWFFQNKSIAPNLMLQPREGTSTFKGFSEHLEFDVYSFYKGRDRLFKLDIPELGYTSNNISFLALYNLLNKYVNHSDLWDYKEYIQKAFSLLKKDLSHLAQTELNSKFSYTTVTSLGPQFEFKISSSGDSLTSYTLVKKEVPLLLAKYIKEYNLPELLVTQLKNIKIIYNEATKLIRVNWTLL